MPANPSVLGLCMKFFGKLPGQTLSQFRDEWNKLSDADKAQLGEGLTNESLTY